MFLEEKDMSEKSQKNEFFNYMAALSKDEFRTLCNIIVESFNQKPDEQLEFDFYKEAI